MLFAVTHAVETVDLAVDRVGDHAANEKTLVESDQAVDLVVGVGLVLTGMVAFFLVKVVIVGRWLKFRTG